MGMIPCFHVGFVSQLPPGFPIALCSLPLWRGTFSSAQQWLCCWEDCLPKERWTPVGKHLGAISSTCYLESGSWNRVGRNKADSVLSLINDCWDRGAGAGLTRCYHGVTSGQECAGLLLCGAEGEPSSLLLFPDAFPLPIPCSGSGSVAGTPAPESRGDGGGGPPAHGECWCTPSILLEGFSCPSWVVSCLVTSSWLCWSFRIPSVAGTLENLWIPSPVGASKLSSWQCRSLEILPLVGAMVLGSWSFRISSLVGAAVLCSWLSLGILALQAPLACPGLVPEELDKLELNVLLGEAGFVLSGIFQAPAVPWSRFCWSRGCGRSLEHGSGASSLYSLEDEGTGSGASSWCSSEQ